MKMGGKGQGEESLTKGGHALGHVSCQVSLRGELGGTSCALEHKHMNLMEKEEEEE